MKHFAFLGLLPIILFGCKDEPSRTTDQSVSAQGNEDPAGDDKNGDSAGGLPFELNLNPPTDQEFWFLYVCRDQMEVPIALVALFKTEEQYAINLMPLSEAMGELKLAEGSATDETVSLVIHAPDAGFAFQGTLKEGIIWGNTILASGMCVPSRMVRAVNRPDAPPEPSPYEGQADFQKLLQSDGDWDSFQQFIQQHPRSPYVVNAFFGLFVQCGPRQMSNEELETLFESIDRTAEIWGERMQEFLRMAAIRRIADFYSYPEFLSEKLATVDGVPGDEIWDGVVERMKEGVQQQIDLALQIEQIPSLEPEARTAALQQLPEVLEVHRFDPFWLAKVGDALTAAQSDELALQYYAKLVSIPGLESPYLQVLGSYREKMGSVSDRLESVWKRLHNDDVSGLEEFKLQTYEQFIEEFEADVSNISFEAESPNVLIELFTGSSCPPCIAADMACSILTDKLPADRVTILQYHLYVPGPDPLTNPDSEARFFSYSSSSTPTAFLNGRELNSLGGPPSSIPENVNSLLNEIRKELGLKAPLQIELTGNRTGDNQISCSTNVVTDSVSSRWRLFVVLAEDKVHFQGENGVPIHEMVVRKMLTPPQGAEPRDGKLTWNGTVDVDQLRKDLNEFLTRDEQKHKYQFPEKPLELKDLHLVAFVQDLQNRRIRQVQSIPVPSIADSTGSGVE